MDMFISETLRLWPPAPGTDRVCVKDYSYDDGQVKFMVEKDTVLQIPIVGLHRDEKYWEDPKKFNPERFSDENKDNITPGAYFPFGVGPRNCIVGDARSHNQEIFDERFFDLQGSRFALMEIKAVIYYLLLNFKFEPNADSQIPVQLKKVMMVMTAEKGIHVALKLRN